MKITNFDYSIHKLNRFHSHVIVGDLFRILLRGPQTTHPSRNDIYIMTNRGWFGWINIGQDIEYKSFV